MKVLYSIVARRSIVENVTGIPSLIDIVEELTAIGAPETGFPEDAQIDAQTHFVTLFEAETEDEKNRGIIPAEYWIDTPSGIKAQGSATVNFQGMSRYRATVVSYALPYGGPGVYTFGFKCEEVVATWRFELKTVPVESTQPKD